MNSNARLPVILSVTVLLLLPALCNAQEETMQDVVYLKDGSIIRGTIIEQIPTENLKIRTEGGNVFVFEMSEIERIVKEKSAVSVTMTPAKPRKSPFLAGALSFFLPGAGQFYNGEVAKGFIMLGVAVTGSALMMSSAWDQVWGNDDEGEPEAAFGAILFVTAWAWSVIDAPLSASKINRENGWMSLNIFGEDFALSLADLSVDGKTSPGFVLSWTF